MECYCNFLEGIENKISSPGYIFDIATLQRKIMQIREFLPSCGALCFAMKANPFLISVLPEQVERLEVCSPGEYEICMNSKFPPEKIIVSGVNKTYHSMERILTLSCGKGIYTIESPLHYEILSHLAEEKGFHLHVMIRLSSGNQFGVDQEIFLDLLQKILHNPNLIFQGIHYFSGTQKKIKKIQKELTMLEDFGRVIKETYGLNHLELEYGPGLAVSYFQDDKVPDSEEQLRELDGMLNQLHIFDRIGIEMGRFISSSCGFFLTKVVDIKKTQGVNYAVVNGGIHQLHYFGQMMGMKIPSIQQIPERQGEDTYVLCGSLCTVNDVMVRDVRLKHLKIGDYLLFENCGAYSMTECPALFLSRELPAIYFREVNGVYRCVRACSDTYLLNTQSK